MTKQEYPFLLTVAIICKNEEKNIQRCLDSVFQEIRDISSVEVILSDSFSTDDTISIAKNYPIKILRLRRDWYHSPAAGRYTAFMHAKGKYFLCVDADMELVPGFLSMAIGFLENDQQAGAVTGILKHAVLSSSDRESLNINRGELFPIEPDRWSSEKPCLLKSIPGSGLFRSCAISEAGGFQPFLRAEEEYELCQRIRRCGYALWYLPIRNAIHYGYEGDQFEEIRRRWRRGLIFSIGSMFKWSASNGFLWENLQRFKQHMIIGGYIMVLPFAVIIAFYIPYITAVWTAGLGLLSFAYVMRKRNIREGMAALIHKAIIGIGIYFMLFSRLPSPSEYPKDVIIMDLTGRN